MRTFGRVLAGLGVAMAGIGGIGAVAMLPPPVLEDVGSQIEERRQALRSHLPEMPDLTGLISGTTEPDCAESGSGDAMPEGEAMASAESGSDVAAACEDDAPEVGIIRGGNSRRPSGAGTRFLAPAAAGEAAAAD